MVFFGHSMTVLATRSTVAIIRRSGRNGLKKARLRLNPNRENGSSRQTGQRSASAPSVPPMPVAPFAPMGHPPVFFLQWSNPTFKERRAIRKILNRISAVVGAGLGGPGMRGIIPSSHRKKREQTSAAPHAQCQNDRLYKNFHCIVCIMSCECRSCQGSLPNTHRKHTPVTHRNRRLCRFALPQDIPVLQTQSLVAGQRYHSLRSGLQLPMKSETTVSANTSSYLCLILAFFTVFDHRTPREWCGVLAEKQNTPFGVFEMLR